MKRRQLVAPAAGLLSPRLEVVAPTHSNAETIPSGLAQPPLSIYLTTPFSLTSLTSHHRPPSNLCFSIIKHHY